MLQTSARLLRLLTMLQARRSWAGPELAERLEVTGRTLRRDVDRLRSLGYPVHSTSGTAGGYSLGAGASLPPLTLDDDEGMAVALALQTAANGGVAKIEEASQRALAKLEQVLPVRLRKRLKTLRSSIVRMAMPGPTVELAAVATLATACAEALESAFEYRDYQGQPSRRHVEPHRMVLVGRRWYLVAWDKQRADWRTFRLDRIEGAITTGSPFVPRSAPEDDLAAYVSRSLASFTYRYKAQVILRAPLADVQRRIPPSAGALEEIDARSCRLHTGANSLDSLVLWLGQLEAEFVIESPLELAQHMRVVIERLRRCLPPD